jgi:predicted DNA repair protein MutK
MPSGLVALLDDIAGITKLAAASLDDVGAAAGKAGSKAMGVVIDDTAVTPRYVTGLSPERELPIIAKIAFGSLRNKLLVLLPAALILSAFAPWAITPLLMLGGAYLCFEGAEKVVEAFGGHPHAEEEETLLDALQLEQSKVSGAIRTDLILSAEIMAIALADVSDSPIATQAAVLALVGIAITIGVYGVVGLIVKMDDVGLHLAERRNPGVRALGRGLVMAMPILMQALSTIGTAAMIWVGGGILVHGLEVLGAGQLAHVIHDMAEAVSHATGAAGPVLAWIVTAIASGLFGLAVGALIALVVNQLRARFTSRPASAPEPHPEVDADVPGLRDAP